MSAQTDDQVISGCADARRDGLVQLDRFPDVAACAGSWGVAGLLEADPTGGRLNRVAPLDTCPREFGDDVSPMPTADCSASNLCAPGWHICDYLEFEARGGNCGPIDRDEGGTGDPAFYAGIGHHDPDGALAAGVCYVDPYSPNATSDLFGCGTIGCNVAPASGEPIDCGLFTRFSGNLCNLVRAGLGVDDCQIGVGPGTPDSPWECGDDSFREALNVRKIDATEGGVLCCREPGCDCVIGGECYSATEMAPDDACAFCDPALSRTEWTMRAGCDRDAGPGGDAGPEFDAGPPGGPGGPGGGPDDTFRFGGGAGCGCRAARTVDAPPWALLALGAMLALRGRSKRGSNRS